MSFPLRARASRWPLPSLALVAAVTVALTTSCEDDAVGPGRTGEPQAGIGAGGGASEPTGGASETRGGANEAGSEAAAPGLEGGGESGGQAFGGAPSAGAPSGGAPSAGAPSGGAPSAGEALGGAAVGGGASGGAPPEEDLGLPCDVLAVLRTRCQSCHSRAPVAGTKLSLVEYADLKALSDVVPTLTVAARAVQRMKDGVSPMPPAPGSVTTAEISALQLWVDEGLPRSTCDEDGSHPNDDPYAAAATCTSASFWPGNHTGALWMMPGAPCIKCHRQYLNFAPLFTVAGTVYPTAHEPDKCYGVPSSAGATIVITDANGHELSPIPVASRGNFGEILPSLALPYQAKVVVGDRERVMLTPQTNGDCNACHTQAGAEGARGRLILP